MPTLWLAQREFGWLSLPVLEYVAELMELPLAWVTSVASFYTMYWKEPKGRWHIQLCRNLSCALRGAIDIQRALEDRSGSGTASAPATGSSPSRRSSVSPPAAPRPASRSTTASTTRTSTCRARSP
jgi:NADH:ubiquinone oxidoreductase subunit E